MNERWVCKRCFADNDDTTSACHRCGLMRGAESSDADRADWAAQTAAATGTPVPGAEPAGWSRWLRFWWVPALAVVLAVGYFATARRDDSGAITGGGTLSVTDLRVGDCFDAEDTDEIGDVDARPCSEAHEYELYYVASHPGEAYPNDDAWTDFIIDECIPAFDGYVGMSYETSALEIQPLTPTAEGWDDGDRVLQCILYDPEDAALTGSLRDANR